MLVGAGVGAIDVGAAGTVAVGGTGVEDGACVGSGWAAVVGGWAAGTGVGGCDSIVTSPPQATTVKAVNSSTTGHTLLVIIEWGKLLDIVEEKLNC